MALPLIFDPSQLPGDDPVADSLTASIVPGSGAITAVPRMFDPSQLPGDNPVAASVVAPLPGSILLILPGVPGPVDAGSVVVTVAQGAASLTLRAADGTTAISAGDGTYSLTAPFPFPLPAGFSEGVTETLSWADTVGGQAQTFSQQGALLGSGSISGLSLSCGAPVINFAAQTAILEAGATQFLCVPTALTDEATGQAADLTSLFAAGSVRIALSQTVPVLSDFQAASMLETPPSPGAGAAMYACLLIGPGGFAPTFRGPGRVFVLVTSGSQVLVARAPGLVVLRG